MARFETPPGEQMQVDFSTIRRGRHRLLAFVGTLGYSRSSAVRFCDREEAASWISGLKAAFVHFGGVPKQVMFDNAKCVVIERDAYGQGLHRWHPGCTGDFHPAIRGALPSADQKKGSFRCPFRLCRLSLTDQRGYAPRHGG